MRKVVALGLVLRSSGWLVAGRICRLVLSTVITIWMARHLEPTAFGTYSYALAILAIASAIAALGLDGVAVRELVRSPESCRELLGTMAVLRFCAGVVAWSVMAWMIYAIRPDDREAQLLLLISGSACAIKFTDVVKGLLEAELSAFRAVLVDLSAISIASILRIVLIANHAPLETFSLAIVCEAAIVAIGLLIVVGRRGYPICGWIFSMARARQLFVSSAPFLLSGLSMVIYMRIDQLMVSDILGDDEGGLYAAAVRLSEAWYFVPLAVVTSMFPAILKSRGVSEERYYEQIKLLCSVLTLVSVMCGLLVTLFSEAVVVAAFGEHYRRAHEILIVHAWCGVFVVMGQITGRWLIAEDWGYLALARNVLGCLLNIVLNLVLIPIWGGVGAAVATLASQAVATYAGHAALLRTRHMFFIQTSAMTFVPLVKAVMK